mmetsp:Transcript_16236/g.28362  ORF Transcript_16236/g.28362 Transcript_16236/m.28362 type:complete len:656 (-) Transcript_16236:95-2062(-)
MDFICGWFGWCTAPKGDKAEFELATATAELDLDQEVPAQCQEFKDALVAKLTERPYLNNQDHDLRQYVLECYKGIFEADPDKAQNALDILDMELDSEEKMIAAAFQKFDLDASGILHGNEVQFMLDYLGFPDSPADVKRIMSVLDTDGDESVSFDEFLDYVGKLGGSSKLFELRHRQIKERVSFRGSVHDKDTLRLLLQECGISPDAQAHWRLTASESEMDSAALMETCQKEAVRHIRHLAKENHERALPGLQTRFQQLGKTDTDLWMCLSWIRELAPILVHLNLDKVGEFLLEDSHYRNQFETNTSSGLLKTSARERWERGLFGTSYDRATAFERPKYGVQNIWNDPLGVQGAIQYGDSYLILKDVRLRCTLSPQDSANLPARRLAVLDYYAHVMAEYSDKELLETIKVAEKGSEKVGDSKKVIEEWGKYKEAQLHGEIHLDKHVDRLVVAERHRPRKAWVERICNKHGWKYSWVNEFGIELSRRQHGQSMGVEDWKEQLKKLGRVGTVNLEKVKPGMCKVCGDRPCAPGTSSQGKPHETCCKGCESGFGHDQQCGTGKRTSKILGVGLCSVGCGRKHADDSDVCCHRCKLGTGLHERTCGLSKSAIKQVEKGRCKNLCGRKAAPGVTKSRKKFDTCCRDCARGTGHSADCIAG